MLVVLIPAHNEVATIRPVVAEALTHGDKVLVIDDGSTDGTAAALDGMGVEVIRHAENIGKGGRLAEGLAHAFGQGASAALTLDADGQHDPAEIPAFRRAAETHPGALVLGSRARDMQAMPPVRARAIRFGDWFISWAAATRIRDAQCGMRLIPREVWDSLAIPKRLCRGFIYETALLLYAAEAGARITPVPIAARYKGFQQRPSHFRPIADFLAITATVTWFLLTRGLCPRGLLVALGIVPSRNFD
ncbi:MAG: glycosyltransferase family 2 protein [Pseudomonadota bacterium]